MKSEKLTLNLIIGATLMSLTMLVCQTKAIENGKIAFVSNGGIFTMNPNGSGRTQIAASGSNPKFSPDGRRIAFFQNGTIYLMNADGSNQTFLVSSGSVGFGRLITISWSPDGQRISFTCGEGICIVDADGSDRMAISNNPLDHAPDWSPDGTKIAFTRSTILENMDIYVMDIYGDNQTRLTVNQIPDYRPVWSPDGGMIVFIQLDGCDFGFCLGMSIFTMFPDGSNQTSHGGFVDLSGGAIIPSWSPDGTKIIFSSENITQVPNDIFVINSNGSGSLLNLTNTPTMTESSPSWGRVPRTGFDFDGDGRADISVFRAADRTWYLNQSTAGFSATEFGLSSDKIAPADFDGDGRTDISVFREGVWYWLNSSNGGFNAIQFGLAWDIPVAGDYTGDGRAELAVYRGGTWYSLNLVNNQSQTFQFGIPTDKPVAADYDGDGKKDQAVYRGGEWHLNRSSQGYAVVRFGLATDKPVIGDYDGDGKGDQAVYRDGTWYLLRSGQGFSAFQFGIASDVPAPADYDGDGRTDAAIYRGGTWWILQSTNGSARNHQFGLPNDSPIPSAFVP